MSRPDLTDEELALVRRGHRRSGAILMAIGAAALPVSIVLRSFGYDWAAYGISAGPAFLLSGWGLRRNWREPTEPDLLHPTADTE